MCIGGEALPSSLSVLRTLRSVLIGSLEQLGRISRMVCYMYYTDVFVGIVNIDKLKSALIAELPDFNVNSNDLTQLVHGLCLFMGYPSCLCKPKKSVEDSLKEISKELKEELKNYKCLLKSIPNSDLNCLSCKSLVVCKCCVLDCINEVQKCKCVQGGSNKNCTCSNDDTNKRCCKDLLEKLKASLSLLNLKADMEICSCTENCCDKGVCINKGSSNCTHCNNLKTSTSDYTVTGLGLLRPSPKRLAERLDKIFGNGSSKSSSGCSCRCNGSTSESCCCLACDNGKCFESCTVKCDPSKCSSHKSPSTCSRKTFCEAIKDVKVLVGSGDMTCCSKGQNCHCGLDPSTSGSNCQSGQCCVVTANGSNKYHSLKCLIRRLVKFFKDLSLDPSQPKSSCLCCELLCVLKICEFLKT
ncbi:hypothetical protein X943_002037, partial [Babesia divergens]